MCADQFLYMNKSVNHIKLLRLFSRLGLNCLFIWTFEVLKFGGVDFQLKERNLSAGWFSSNSLITAYVEVWLNSSISITYCLLVCFRKGELGLVSKGKSDVLMTKTYSVCGKWHHNTITQFVTVYMKLWSQDFPS